MATNAKTIIFDIGFMEISSREYFWPGPGVIISQRVSQLCAECALTRTLDTELWCGHWDTRALVTFPGISL